MFILALALIAIGCLINLAGSIWMICVAFSRSILWGLAILLIPFALLFFLFQAWSEAKKPFLCSLSGVILVVAGAVLFPQDVASKQPGVIGALNNAFHNAGESSSNSSRSRLDATPAPAPTPTREEMIARLHARETDLLARKAALKPGDHAGEEAISREIWQYNADLKAVMGTQVPATPAPATPAPATPKAATPAPKKSHSTH